MSKIHISYEEDQKARRIAQSEFSKHVVVEAGAGTGKTATLIARIVFWSLTEGWKKHGKTHEAKEDIALAVAKGIASITFTDNACKEMAERLGYAYQALVSSSSLNARTVVGLDIKGLQEKISEEEIKQRALALLSVCDQFQIQTIHSFCRNILIRFPRQAGLHLYFVLDAEQNIVERFITTLLLEDLQDAYYGSEKHHKHYKFLLSQQKPVHEIARVLRDLLYKGSTGEGLKAQSITPQQIKRKYQLIARVIKQVFEKYDALPKPLPARSVHHKIKGFLAAWLEFFNAYDESQDFQEHETALIQLWDILKKEYSTAETNIKKKCEPPTSKKPRYPDNILDLQKEFQELVPLLDDLRIFHPYSLSLLQELLADLLPELKRRLQQRGVLGFEDLLREAKDLLKDRKDIAVQIGSELDLLMVDEFQDTSVVQCEFLDALVLDVEKMGETAPKLFIVGDPKQSIYGWRQANIGSYFSFVEKILQQGGLRLDLVLNYRSTPRILDEVTAVFAPIMHLEDEMQPDFIPLLPNRSKEVYTQKEDDIDPIEYWISWSDPSEGKTAAETGRKNQAKMIVEDIIKQKQRREKAFQFSDFAVLFRSKSNIDLLVEVLQEHNIPYVVSGDENFYRRKEIIDVVSFLLAIFEPSDQVSLVGLLRSKLVGLPDFALYPLWREGFPQYFLEASRRTDIVEKLDHFCSVLQEESQKQADLLQGVDLGNWIERFRIVILSIIELRADMQTLPTDLFFNKLRRRSLLEVLESSVSQASYRLNNLELFFLELFEKVEQSSGNWAEVLLFLRQAIQREEAKTEASSKETTSNAVRILSIHKSKGLDFRQVYIVDIERTPPNFKSIPTIVEKVGDDMAYSLLGFSSFGVQELLQKEARREFYERVRVFYVAMTRAKERLVLIGNFINKSSSAMLGRPVSRSTSFLGLLFAKEKDCLGRLQASSEVFWSQIGSLSEKAYPMTFQLEDTFFRVGYSSVEQILDEKIQGEYSEQELDASVVDEWENWKSRQEWTKKAEKRKLGERNSSLLNLLRKREYCNDHKDVNDEQNLLERAYLNILEIQNSLLYVGGISEKSFFNWKKKIERQFFETGSEFRALANSIELLGKLSIARELNLPELQYQGETILLNPEEHHAQRQEYWIQGIVEQEEAYLLVEVVWDWKKIQKDLAIEGTQELLIHKASRHLEEYFSLSKPFQPAFFDLGSGELIRLD